MANPEIAQLEERVHHLMAAFRQARLESRRALQERDRLQAMNNELRKRVEAIVERIRTIESEAEA